MTDSVIELIAAGGFLLAGHFIPAAPRPRAALVGWIGETAYLGLYSLVAIVGLVWLVGAYHRAPVLPIWPALPGLAWIPLLVLPWAMLLLVGGYTTRNPTAIGFNGGAPPPARGILRITRHPVMWAIGLWALAHLPVRGDLASLLFFGTLAWLALAGAMLIDAKSRVTRGPAWDAFAATTGNLPFAAILQQRQSLTTALVEIGWWRFLLAAGFYAGGLALHPILVGVSAVPAG